MFWLTKKAGKTNKNSPPRMVRGEELKPSLEAFCLEANYGVLVR